MVQTFFWNAQRIVNEKNAIYILLAGDDKKEQTSWRGHDRKKNKIAVDAMAD